jgi:hypothetical protein
MKGKHHAQQRVWIRFVLAVVAGMLLSAVLRAFVGWVTLQGPTLAQQSRLLATPSKEGRLTIAGRKGPCGSWNGT